MDFPYLKLWIQNLKANSEQDSCFKVCMGGRMPKIIRLQDCTKIWSGQRRIDQVSHDALLLKVRKSHWFSSRKKWLKRHFQTQNSHSSKYFKVSYLTFCWSMLYFPFTNCVTECQHFIFFSYNNSDYLLHLLWYNEHYAMANNYNPVLIKI